MRTRTSAAQASTLALRLPQELVPHELTVHVLAARDGDATAFGRLVELTSGIVSSLAMAVLRNSDLGADVTQDVFLAAWRGIRNLRRPESFLAWLRQLTRNRVRDALRASATRNALLHPSGADTDALMAGVPDPRPSPVDAIILAEDGDATTTTVASAMAELPASSREVLILYYGTQRSTPELAKELALSADAARKRLSRARVHLRAALDARACATARRGAPRQRASSAATPRAE